MSLRWVHAAASTRPCLRSFIALALANQTTVADVADKIAAYAATRRNGRRDAVCYAQGTSLFTREEGSDVMLTP